MCGNGRHRVVTSFTFIMPGNSKDIKGSAGPYQDIKGSAGPYQTTFHKSTEGESDNGKGMSLYSVDAMLDSRGNTPNLNETNSEDKGWKSRHTFALMNLLGQCLAFMNRNTLSIAIVAMVASPTGTASEDPPDGDVCPYSKDGNDTLSYSDGEFDWDEQLQGVILGSFFYGYVSSCFISGLLTEYFGGRLMFGFSIFCLSVLSMLTPVSARTSVNLLIANKVITGVLQGPMYPSLHSLMASRIPPHLRARYNSVCLTGSTFGSVFAMALGGLICSSSFLGGWPAVFYIFGAGGILWSLLWFALVKDEPSIEVIHSPGNPGPTEHRIKLKEVDWKCIAMSPAFWSLLFFHFGDNYGYYMLSTEIPTYLSNIQHFDLNKNGLLASLPYIGQIVFSVLWGIGINHIIFTGKVSVLASRKISTAVGMYVAGAALVLMCFVGCNSTLAVVVLCISVTVAGASNSGGYLGEQDMCPPSLVGIIKGLTTTFTVTCGFIAPLVTGSIVSGNETLSAWKVAFLIAAALYILPGTIYLMFVTVEVQPWVKHRSLLHSNADQPSHRD